MEIPPTRYATTFGGVNIAYQVVGALVAGSGLVYRDRGEHDLEGIPDRRHLYGVVP